MCKYRLFCSCGEFVALSGQVEPSFNLVDCFLMNLGMVRCIFLGGLVALTGQIMPQHNLFAFLGDELLFLTLKRDFSCCPSGR